MSISITTRAWSKMRHILKLSNNEYGFIYSAASGGCNGFSFKLGLLDKSTYTKISSTKYLNVLENDTTKLYVDPLSEMYLLGTIIDYVTEDYMNGQLESKFVFDVDKNLMSSCGCGISFSPKVI